MVRFFLPVVTALLDFGLAHSLVSVPNFLEGSFGIVFLVSREGLAASETSLTLPCFTTFSFSLDPDKSIEDLEGPGGVLDCRGPAFS